jgi:hypothetical protein
MACFLTIHQTQTSVSLFVFNVTSNAQLMRQQYYLAPIPLVQRIQIPNPY